MIIRNNEINIGDIDENLTLKDENNESLYKKALFFDLEHYVYKKPVCIGVFGCSFFDEKENILKVTQYMIENNKDARDILDLAKSYFISHYENYEKRYIVTFSGNNDFTVINYLFNKYKFEYKILDDYKEIDLQNEYSKKTNISTGLKNLEKEFNITRESELISGSNLAKTFGRIIKDPDYFERMPDEKKQKILLYNEQDVVSLFYMCTNWHKIIPLEP